jgi:hypothetical protein
MASPGAPAGSGKPAVADIGSSRKTKNSNSLHIRQSINIPIACIERLRLSICSVAGEGTI